MEMRRVVIMISIIIWIMVISCAVNSAELLVTKTPKEGCKYGEKQMSRIYQVNSGDTFYGLFGQNWKIVAKVNRVSPRALMPGMKLVVPAAPDMDEVEDEYCPLPEKIEDNIQLLVVLSDQVIGRYKEKKLEAWFPISSGKEGHETPTGFFYILEKSRIHKSNIYPKPDGGEPMPYALRFFGAYWIHEGQLPGRPASHGCIRLMHQEAKKIFRDVEVGDRILIK